MSVGEVEQTRAGRAGGGPRLASAAASARRAGKPAPRRLDPASFSLERINELGFRLETTTRARLLARLDAQRGRGAIVGERGRGKSRLLGLLGEELEEKGYAVRRLVGSEAASRRALAAACGGSLPGPGDALLVDQGERLGGLERACVAFRARRAGVVLATLDRPGMLPALHRCETTHALFAALVAELAGEEAAARLAADLPRIFRDAGGDLGLAFARLRAFV